MRTTEAEATEIKCCMRDKCIGRACMAWRWVDPPPKIEIFRAGESDAGFAKRRDETNARRRGFCGLAGIPMVTLND